MKADKKKSIRQEQKEETRKRLIEAFIDCLVELGYPATSIPEISRRAGLAQGTLYVHFASKLDLVYATLDYIVASDSTKTDRFVAEHKDEEDFFAHLVYFLWKNVLQGKNARAMEELDTLIIREYRLFKSMEGKLQTIRAETQRRWEECFISLDPEIPLEDIQWIVHVFLEGMTSHFYPGEQPETQETVMSRFIHLVEPLLRKRNPQRSDKIN